MFKKFSFLASTIYSKIVKMAPIYQSYRKIIKIMKMICSNKHGMIENLILIDKK